MDSQQTLGNLLDDKLVELRQRLEGCESQLRLQSSQQTQKAEELEALRVSLAGKAEAKDLDVQIEEMAQALKEKAESAEMASREQIEAVKKILLLKADASLVPCKDKAAAVEALTSRHQQRLDEAERNWRDVAEAMSTQLAVLQRLVDGKADAKAVPSLELMDLRLQEKADTSNVPTNAHLQAMIQLLDLKADAERVPSKAEVQALAKNLEEMGSLKSQLQSLQALVQSKEQELLNLQKDLQRKADLNEVATSLEVRLLNGKVEEKADAKDAVTLAQFQALSATLANKADSWEVPSLSEFRAMDQVLRKHGEVSESLKHLKSQLEKKAGEDELVLLKDRLTNLVDEVHEKAESKDVPNMEEFDTLKEAMEMKANLSDVPSMQNFVALQKDMPSRAAILVLNNALQGKANAHTAATKEELQALVTMLQNKADITSVPNWKDFHHLRDRVQRKADREAVPSMTQFQSLNSTLGKLCETPGSLKRRRSPELTEREPASPGHLRLPGTPRVGTPRVAMPGPCGPCGPCGPGTPGRCPETPRPLVASPRESTRCATPQPLVSPPPASPALAPFAPRKVARCASPAPPEVLASGATPKAKAKATPKTKATPEGGKTTNFARPRGKAPVVEVGKKRGQAMTWNKKTGLWQEP